MIIGHSIECDKCDLAKQHLDRLWREVFWRRENEQKISVWSVGLFGALLAVVYGREHEFDCVQKTILSLFPVILGFTSAWYLHKNWSKCRTLACIIVELNKALGAWEEGYLIPHTILYPEDWQNWGKESFIKDKVSVSYLLLVIVASLLTAAGIWIS